jgi:hypothetical protein
MEIRFNRTVVTEMNCCVLVRRLASSLKSEGLHATVAQETVTEIRIHFFVLTQKQHIRRLQEASATDHHCT